MRRYLKYEFTQKWVEQDKHKVDKIKEIGKMGAQLILYS